MAKLAGKHLEQLSSGLERQNEAQTAFPSVKALLHLQLNVFSVDTLPVSTECGSVASPPRPCQAAT